jgi:filamentous hemagglutinin family protein
MGTRGRSGSNGSSDGAGNRGGANYFTHFKLAPIARAIALTLAAGSTIGNAYAVQPFSPAWFANKGAIQATVAATGLLPNGAPVSSLNPQAQQQQANTQLQQSIVNLGQAARGIAWLQGIQASQRQIALGIASNIPDGLGVNGLDTGSLASGWVNASAPTQSTDANGKTVVDIQQTADKAIANWQTFNVGKNTIVQFDQASADWAILNRITDPAMAPSQIQGQIRAPGTVLIVNQNGIVFSGTSQINTRNLVAAAADITDAQFTTNGIYSAQASNAYVPSFTNANGALIVQPGAQINTAASTSATQGGGYVLLLGASVTNAGSVTTPGGQAELAAGDFFIVRPGQGTAANQYSTTRGNEVAPQFNPGSTAGNVTNSGFLEATEGDITLAGRTVVQDGVALATTSVNQRGTIHLLNSASDTQGSIVITDQAVTAILLDDSGDTALDSQRDALITQSAAMDVLRRAAVPGVFDNLSTQDDREDLSRIEIVSGGNVSFEGGSTTLATGGQLAVSAGSAGRTTVADGATLDVSGAVGVSVAMASNNVLVNVQGNEQRDDPLNRDTTDLNSSNVWIDKNDLIFVPAGTGGDTSDRWYTAGGLLEVSGYLGLAGHSIGEWAAQGGSIAFTGGAVVTQSGSNINLSGGSLNVQTGFMQQTWLTGVDGQLYNVDDAPGDIAYTGIYKGFEVAHTRWGADAAEFFYNPLIAPKQRLENGYTTGRDAGQLIVATASAVLEGDITANTYQGPQQTQKGNVALDGYNQSQNAVAQGAQLIVGNYQTVDGPTTAGAPALIPHSLTPVLQQIDFDTDQADIADSLIAGAALPANLQGVLDVDSDRLNGFGLGAIIVAATGSISVDGALTVVPGGTIELHAPQVLVNADLTARGGSIALGNVLETEIADGVLGLRSLPAPTGAGATTDVLVAQGVTLDARGLWSNLQLSPDDIGGLPFVDGGTVNILSSGAVTLDTDSVVDVSSGAALLKDGSLQGGTGGNVTLAAGYVTDTNASASSMPLQLLGTISAYGVKGGGTLNIESGSAIGIGGQLLDQNGILQAGESSAANLRLASDYVVGMGEAIPIDFSITVNTLLPGVAVTKISDSLTFSIVTQADWVVPASVQSVLFPGGGFVRGGTNTTIPKGTTITQIFAMQVGFMLPADVFPNGVPIAPITTNYTAGTVVAAPLVIPAGTLIAAGDVLPRTAAVGRVTQIDPDLFQSGFSQYVVNGHDGVVVADGATVSVAMPVYQSGSSVQQQATGTDPAQALQLWTPPVYQEDPAHGVLTQRGGAGLSLVAGTPFDASTASAPIQIGNNTVITVDPGSAITLDGNGGQVTVDGRLNAWGGSIDISSLPGNVLFDQASTTRSIWIGDNAVLDAASRAYVAVDNQGRAYGVAPDGGSIDLGLSDSFIVIRPGALLDASGSSATIDLAAGSSAFAPAQTVTLAGDGGSIALNSYAGMYIDGDLRAAAGGAGAAGGSLTLNMDNRVYNPGSETIIAPIQVLHSITLVQDQQPSGLMQNLLPGQADANMAFGNAVLSVEQIEAGGFGALTLAAHDLLVFQGNIDLSLGSSLDLQHGALTVSTATPTAQVNVSAPYIRLDGGVWQGVSGVYSPGLIAALPGQRAAAGSEITFSADLIDIYGEVLNGVSGRQGDGPLTASANGGFVQSAPLHSVDFAGFATLSLDSGGDIRFGNGSLSSVGDIAVSAAQLYPMSGDKGVLAAGLITTVANFSSKVGVDPNSQLVIRSNGEPAPVPDSVFGGLILVGGTVDQGGVVRAPLGTISMNDLGGTPNLAAWNTALPNGFVGSGEVILRDGSLTSVSADGLVMPFGGTSDGLTYQGTEGANGADTTLYSLGSTSVNRPNAGFVDSNAADSGVLVQGITIGGTSLIGEAGAVLDLSGGGDLRGAGFISGRGGSVNVLTTPLVNANPVLYSYSKSSDQVYAIVPGRASDYAPVIADKGAGDPAIGRQIEIGANVPGLPAGTYTLLPASYALMPGAWRVELGAQITTPSPATVAVPGGSWITSGTLETANTTIRDALPTQLILSPAAAVRDDSQYNEMSYADFAISQAALFGNVRPYLPEDGKILRLDFKQNNSAQPLQFDGIAKMNGADGGIDGQLIVTGNAPIDITAPNAAPTAGAISLAANDLNAFGAASMSIGGWYTYFDGLSSLGDGARLYFTQFGNTGTSVHVQDGADLKSGQIFLIGQDVTVDGGATLDTRDFSAPGVDSTLGFVYANSLKAGQTLDTPAVLAVGNGQLDFLAAEGTGVVNVADGANLLTEGTIAFVAPGGLNLGNANMGARYLTVSQNQIDIGNADALAAAQMAGVLPAGWQLTQDVLDRLLHPSADADVPALERLSLTAGGAFNFFGSVTLDTGDSQAQLVFNTPAFYGWGTSSDVVQLTTNTFVWNGVATGGGTTADPYVSSTPAAIVAGGPGTGAGRLVIDANTVLFGYDALSRPQTQATLDRVALGFGAVDINAADSITANSKGSLSVGQSLDVNGNLQGGSLTMNTPLLTGAAGSIMSYISSGAIQVALPAGATPADTAATTDLGASVTLQGQSVALDTAVALPSGALTINASGDIDLGDNAHIDLAGRGVAFFDVTKYSWGGDVTLASSSGSIRQSAGSRIDVSAGFNNAGSLTANAAAGTVRLAGTLQGKGGDGFSDGQFTVAELQLGDAGFSALNQQLNDAGFFGSRDFTIEQGDLTVGNGVRAREVSITVNGGSLTVDGLIDASGTAPGAIQLAARNDLTLASSAVLDAHGTVLQIDSDGAAIDAQNKATVDLTAATGMLTLAAGSTINESAPDGMARGELNLNAERTGETSGDINIAASGPLTISGAASIAVNAFWTYVPTDPNGTIVQNNGDTTPVAGAGAGADAGFVGLDQIDTNSRIFIDAAWANTTLQGRLAGLTAYGAAYHLRPGVEIDSATPNGDLTVSGDVDLSGYRYGPDADPALRGSGEPGVLILRAGGNLNINGSITDGFAVPGATPDDNGWGVLLPTGLLTAPLTVASAGVVLAAGATLPLGSTLNFDVTLTDPNQLGLLYLQYGSVIPSDAPTLQMSFNNDTVATAPIYNADGTILFNTGDTIPAFYPFSGGEILGAGFNIGNNDIYLASVTFRAGTPINIFPADVTLGDNLTLPAGATLPVGTDALYAGAAIAPSRPVGPDGTQGKMWANAPMLAPGMQSWSMRLVGGADVDSADTRALQSLNVLGSGGNVILSDTHYAGMGAPEQQPVEALSVIRTGTGDLDILAGGSYVQDSLFGVYTAGTAIDAGISADYNAPRATQADGTVLGAINADPVGNPGRDYESTLNTQRMWFTQQGGDVTLSAQGDITGYQTTNSESIGDWLWRQGGAGVGQQTAWGVNFGSYVSDSDGVTAVLGQAGFSGVGALGGGNVTVNAGGNIGVAGDTQRGLVVAVAGSGRVVTGMNGTSGADDTVVQTGGGNLNVTAGGKISGGQLVDLRGNTTVNAGSLGTVGLIDYGTFFGDPRGLDANTAYAVANMDGVGFAPGDGAVTVNTMGDLVLGDVIDPGRAGLRAETEATTTDGSQTGSVASWFTLWRNGTAIDAFSAGGNVAPLGDAGSSFAIATQTLPPILNVVAAGGNIYLAAPQNQDFLMPSPQGELELLAGGLISASSSNSLQNDSSAFGPLGTAASSMATPLHAAWRMDDTTDTLTASNYWGDANHTIDSIPPYSYVFDAFNLVYSGSGGDLFMFGPNTVTDDSAAGNGVISRVYADTDVLNLQLGVVASYNSGQSATYYDASKPVRILAGSDIVNSGGLIVQDAPTDVSMIAAAGSIIYTNFSIAGPGTLEVSAGKQVYQGNMASLVSLGAIETGDNRPGAGIVVQAGLGAGAPGVGATDFTGFAALYLDPANLANPALPLASQPGKVVKTYDGELIAWLAQRYGFVGNAAQALAYFDGLAPEQQRIFVRQVYYAELTAGGREFNDPTSQRFGSYLRGRDAIAELFPTQDAQGNAITRQGDLTLYQGAQKNAGIRTIAGGDIQTLTPGGQTVIGVEGVAPSSNSDTPAGLLTQGEGDIQMYSEDSILLGLSRIMTTFGGDILAWSATGDINAGRGAKTTLVYTPPEREYDNDGDVKLSPNVPSTGAGIATLDPLPEVAPGDIDLIAPLGTIDAGEAGIRVSGNINLAALQVVNAANIEVKGKATGIPMIAEVNVGALTNASAAASQAAMAAQDVVQRDRNAARQALPSIFTVRVLGFGNDPIDGADKASPPTSSELQSGGLAYDAAKPLRFVGVDGDFDPKQAAQLTDDERRSLLQDR